MKIVKISNNRKRSWCVFTKSYLRVNGFSFPKNLLQIDIAAFGIHDRFTAQMVAGSGKFNDTVGDLLEKR